MAKLPRFKDRIKNAAKNQIDSATAPIRYGIQDTKDALTTKRGLMNTVERATGDKVIISMVGILATGLGGIGKLISKLNRETDDSNKVLSDSLKTQLETRQVLEKLNLNIVNGLDSPSSHLSKSVEAMYELLTTSKKTLSLQQQNVAEDKRRHLLDIEDKQEQARREGLLREGIMKLYDKTYGDRELGLVKVDNEPTVLGKVALRIAEALGIGFGLEAGMSLPKMMFNTFKNAFGLIFGLKFLKKIIAKDGLSVLGKSIKMGIGNFAKSLTTGTIKVFRNIFSTAFLVGSIWNAIKGGLEAWEKSGDIGQAMLGLFGGIVEFFSFGLINSEQFRSTFTKGAEMIGQGLGKLFLYIRDYPYEEKLKEERDNLYRGILGLAGGVNEWLNNVITDFINSAPKTTEAIVGFVEDMKNYVLGFRESLRKFAIDTLLKIPGIGDDLAKKFMTAREKAIYKNEETIKELDERIEKVRKSNVGKGFIFKNEFLTQKERDAEVQRLKLNRKYLEKVQQNLTKQNVGTPNSANRMLQKSEENRILKEMKLGGFGGSNTTIAPISTSINTVQEATPFIAPMNSHNNDDTFRSITEK